MVDINPAISVITLNYNGTNIPIKRQRLSEWIKKENPPIWFLQETHLNYKYTYKVKGWRKIYHANSN